MTQAAVLVADGDLPREGGENRPLVQVAVGVLLQDDGAQAPKTCLPCHQFRT